jgi:hypothetical protein
MNGEVFAGPALYRVYVTTTAKYKGAEPFISRVGDARSMEGCRKLIAEDLAAMSETFGGLIAPVGTKGRSYRVFKSEGWTELEMIQTDKPRTLADRTAEQKAAGFTPGEGEVTRR